MTTYSVRCRNAACRHRRVTETHPDDYKVVPACSACGKRAGWRVEGRAYNQRDLCNCSGPEVSQEHGKPFPHRTHNPYCDQNPQGPRNQLKARGVTVEDMPLELMGEPCTTEEAPF